MVYHGGDCVSLRGAHSKYLVAESDGSANANRAAAGPWEKFTLITHPDGLVSFRSHHGKYLVAESDGDLNANRSAIGPWEKFRACYSGGTRPTVTTPVKSTPVIVTLLSHHGKYVVAEPDGEANANRDKVWVCVSHPTLWNWHAWGGAHALFCVVYSLQYLVIECMHKIYRTH